MSFTLQPPTERTAFYRLVAREVQFGLSSSWLWQNSPGFASGPHEPAETRRRLPAKTRPSRSNRYLGTEGVPTAACP